MSEPAVVYMMHHVSARDCPVARWVPRVHAKSNGEEYHTPGEGSYECPGHALGEEKVVRHILREERP